MTQSTISKQLGEKKSVVGAIIRKLIIQNLRRPAAFDFEFVWIGWIDYIVAMTAVAHLLWIMGT